MQPFEWIVICMLAVWRVSCLLVYEDAFEWLRQRVGVGMFDVDTGKPITIGGSLLSCMWCCSLALSVPLGVATALCLREFAGVVLYPLAISGGSILLHHFSRMHLIVGGDNG
jgi:hypothetical protein